MARGPIEFVGGSLDDLRAFPSEARRESGYQLDRVQHGLDPSDWKSMPTVGSGVREIRVRQQSDAFRVLYVAKLAGRVYVLHCFQKKTQRTPARHLDLARNRYKQTVAEIGHQGGQHP